MNQESSQPIIYILSGRGIEVSLYPEKGRENIDTPGFYFNPLSASIEHWSLLCDYTKVMPIKNRNNLVLDGFISLRECDDIDHLVKRIGIWKKHLKKYGAV